MSETVHIYGTILGTMVAGIYKFDTYAVIAEDKEQADDKIAAEKPWEGQATEIDPDYLGTAYELAQRDETTKDILWDRHTEENND